MSGVLGVLLAGKASTTTYSGPGNIVSGAVAWWGLRAYNLAYATGSNPCMDVVDTATGLTTTTINIKTDGSMDQAALTALGYAVSVTKLYDQTGNGNHLSQATLASMPTIAAASLGSFSTIAANGAQTIRKTSLFTSTVQPLSVSVVAKRTTANGHGLISDGSAAIDIYFHTGGTNAELYAGTSLDNAGAATGSWYAMQAIANGASSDMVVDGVSATGAAGAGGFTDGVIIYCGDAFGQFLTGNTVEAGIWPSAFASGDKTSMNSNQHTYWGF